MPVPPVPVPAWPPAGGPNDHLYAPQNAAPPYPAPEMPSIDEIRHFQTWARTQQRDPPPTWGEYQLMLHIMRTAAPLPVPPANAPAPPAIDPQLGAVDNSATMEQRMQGFEAELADLKKKRAHPEDGEDANDKDSDNEESSGRRRKKARLRVLILCAKGASLTQDQKAAKQMLLVSI